MLKIFMIFITYINRKCDEDFSYFNSVLQTIFSNNFTIFVESLCVFLKKCWLSVLFNETKINSVTDASSFDCLLNNQNLDWLITRRAQRLHVLSKLVCSFLHVSYVMSQINNHIFLISIWRRVLNFHTS